MKETFRIGCCYYPEHWDAARMEEDIARIKDLGFNTIRMGEFSWSLYEKREGEYDFSFLERTVALAAKAGLQVILGTPTAAPPKWLTDRHPEVLCQNEQGTTMHYGSRQHHNHTSPVYLQYCAAITEAMVKAFCKYDNVIGWQLDNELHCHRSESYAPSDDAAFGAWAREKYKTIEALNAAWGTDFWSMTLEDFSAVECPHATTTHKNPALLMDYYRFLSDAAIHYARLQTKIIRAYMPQAFITHNGYFRDLDYAKLTETCLDFLSFDSYPAFLERDALYNGRRAAFRLAQTRACSEKFMILEQQSGPGGQLHYLLPTPLPGQIRLWTYQSIAHGAVGILYFRYRTALFGAEQLWYGIYDHDGEENHRSREVRRITEELTRVGDLFLQNRIRPRVAIYADYNNACCIKAEPFFADETRGIFNCLSDRNVAVDLVHDAKNFDRYKVVILPHIAVADQALAAAVEEFAAKGGIVILSARSGVKDFNGNYRPLRSPGVFRKAAGCSADWFTALPAHTTQQAEMEGKTYPVGLYYETLELEGGESIAAYTEGFCRGRSAVVRKGNVYYIGFYGKNYRIYYDLVARHLELPCGEHKYLEQVELGDYVLYLNHSDRPVPLQAEDLLTEKRMDSLEPYGVALTQKQA